MTFKTAKVRDLDACSYRQAYSLNLRKRGFSRGHMRDCRRQKHEHSTIILAYSGRRLLGWALMVQCLGADGAFKEYSTNFYVRKSARGKGVGADLFQQVVARLLLEDRVAHVCIWSPDSERFYTANTNPRIRVIVSPRYKPTIST